MSFSSFADEPATVAVGSEKLSTTIDLSVGKASWIEKLTITPRALQSSDQESPISLGLGYSFKAKPVLKDMTAEIVIGDGPPPPTRQLAFEIEASGLYASKVEANQSKLVDLSTKGSWLWVGDSNFAGTVFSKTAFGAAYAREQGTGTRESRWEISQGLGTLIPKFNYMQLLSQVALAKVSPEVDVARSAVVGGALDDYNRWDVELVVVLPVLRGTLQKVELNHRQFLEISPPDSVRAAGLNRSKLSSVYFGLDGGLFVAYSHGGLPADRKESRVFQVGWSTNLE